MNGLKISSKDHTPVTMYQVSNKVRGSSYGAARSRPANMHSHCDAFHHMAFHSASMAEVMAFHVLTLCYGVVRRVWKSSGKSLASTATPCTAYASPPPKNYYRLSGTVVTTGWPCRMRMDSSAPTCTASAPACSRLRPCHTCHRHIFLHACDRAVVPLYLTPIGKTTGYSYGGTAAMWRVEAGIGPPAHAGLDWGRCRTYIAALV